MTKADLVEKVAEAIGPGITKRDYALVIDGFLAAVKTALARGDSIEIRGSVPSRCGTTRLARPGTREPASPSRSRLGASRSSNPRPAFVPGWTEGHGWTLRPGTAS